MHLHAGIIPLGHAPGSPLRCACSGSSDTDPGDRAGRRSKRSVLGPLRLAIDRVASMMRSRWIAAIGIASAAAGGLYGLWMATHALPVGEVMHGYAPLDAVTSFFGRLKLLDERLFVFLNSLGSERWDGLWLLVTHKHSWIPAYLALMYLVYRHHGLKNTLVILALIVVMITVTDQGANFFKQGFERLRPCREEHLREIMRYIAPRCGRYGFFSAHAANSMAFAVFLGLLFRNICKHLLLLLLFWASIVSFSRIYLGVHYPLDTLTGMVIGALVGFLAYKVHAGLKDRGSHRFSARYSVLLKATLNKPFDRLRACPGPDPGANGMLLIPFVVSLSNHDRNRLPQRCLKAIATSLSRGAVVQGPRPAKNICARRPKSGLTHV